MLTGLKNLIFNRNRYRENNEAVIISCFFNPQASPYRSKAFNHFYKSIKHMNHLILECVIGDAKPELKPSKYIQHVKTNNLLWHKEALLNLAVKRLPKEAKYVFWVDADVIFTNKNWLTDSVKEFKQGAQILQPFEYCAHMEQDELEPGYVKDLVNKSLDRHLTNPKIWRSFCANFVDNKLCHRSNDYNTHGHVGFAWGATRELLEKVPLYDKALIGGADHIIAHAAAGQIPHPCIDKSFTDDLESVYEWSRKFWQASLGKIAYTKGDLYHIWHGDIEKRQYLKRIQDFTPETKSITEKDENGLYVNKKGDSPYIKDYFDKREVKAATPPKKYATGGKPVPAMCGAGCTHTHNHYNDYTVHHTWPTSNNMTRTTNGGAAVNGYDNNGGHNATDNFS